MKAPLKQNDSMWFHDIRKTHKSLTLNQNGDLDWYNGSSVKPSHLTEGTEDKI